MKRIVKILMERDGLSKEDAISQKATFFREMSEDIATGGDPFEWGDKVINHYKTLNIDPMTKSAVFSDSLSFNDAIKIYNYFNGRITSCPSSD